MSIQGNVNQALGIGAALLSQTGRAQTVRAQAAAKQNVKAAKSAVGTLKESAGKLSSWGELASFGDITAGVLDKGVQAYMQLGNPEKTAQFIAGATQAREIAANARAEMLKASKVSQKKAIGGKNGNN